MKVGDYVRNKYGIAKVIDIENNKGIDILVFDKPICFLVDKETGKITDDKLLNKLALIDDINLSKIKHSPNIIDLIEIGDYVNGSKVIDIAQAPEKALYTEDINQKGALLPIVNNRIESVVTKEQFKSMEYKVGK